MAKFKSGLKPGDKVTINKLGQRGLYKHRLDELPEVMTIKKIVESTHTNTCPFCYEHNSYAIIEGGYGGIWECLLEKSKGDINGR